MTLRSASTRRGALRGAMGIAAILATPAWTHAAQAGRTAQSVVVAQIIDSSVGQLDVSRDFLIGSRAAWQEINARGGVNGRFVKHQVIEVDGTTAGLRTAINSIKALANCVALSGTAGDRTASQLVALLQQDGYDIAHVAPWLQDSHLPADKRTFPIFASRQDQIAQALKSLSIMGIPELGAVYASELEYAAYRRDVELGSTTMGIKLRSFKPQAELAQTGRELNADSPRILLFLGGTPELVQFLQGIGKQDRQRYVVAMADVNLQTMMQIGAARHSPVMATQVVPMVNSALPVVKAYRETLGRLFDEPATPQSLAGYIAARYTSTVLGTLEGTPTRQSMLQAFQLRNSTDIGGFRISFNALGRGGSYVTQSMVTPDGRLIG
jgi:ABC-type branched-subunit amino acid transport system substrate-binding protein